MIHKIFNALYHEVSVYQISHQERRRLKLKAPEYIYGEVEFNSFEKLLSIVKPTAEDKFYDLGSGAGKAVIITALLYPELNKIVGIELLPALNQLSVEKLIQLQQQYASIAAQVKFVQADFLDYDFSDASIIFVNAAAFMPDFWQSIVQKFESLKTGCRIIVASKYLPIEQYLLIHTGTHLMGWGDAGVNVYVKK